MPDYSNTVIEFNKALQQETKAVRDFINGSADDFKHYLEIAYEQGVEEAIALLVNAAYGNQEG
tara:strand:+ start:909 stop:1097 length:189 start_codon:yes stop_codon:yes gene_type:complete